MSLPTRKIFKMKNDDKEEFTVDDIVEIVTNEAAGPLTMRMKVIGTR